MGFDAATVVQPLDWDFTKYGAGSGTVPEPSDKDIDTLFKDLTKVSRDIALKMGGLTADATPEQLMTALSAMDESAVGLTQLIGGFTKAFAKLCKDQPSSLQLNKLPMRVRMYFYVWLVGELRPEVGGGVSMPRLDLNGVRAIGTRA